MDLQALDAAFFQTSTRPQRGETPSENDRLFTAELNQAMSQRRQEIQPRPERARSERSGDRPNDRADQPVRRGDASEPHARRSTDAANRQNRDQDRVAAADAPRPSDAPAESEASDDAAGIDVAVDDGADTDQPAVAAAPVEAAEESDTPAPVVAIVPAPTDVIEVSTPTVAPSDGDIALVAAPVDALDGPAPVLAPTPTDDSTIVAPAASVATQASADAALAAMTDVAEAPAPSTSVLPASLPTTETAPQPATVAAQPAAAVPAAATTSTATPAPVSAEAPVAVETQASVAVNAIQTQVQTPPSTDPAITIAVAAETAPVKPAPSSLLALQTVDEPTLPAAPVENAPAPTAAVTATAVQPAAQATDLATQTQTPDQAAVVAQPVNVAAANGPAFANAVEDAAAADGIAEAAAIEQAEAQAGNPVHGSAERRANVEQAVRAEASQPARQNLPPQPVADQIAVRIAKQTQSGDGKITMQLRPEALGRVDVDLEVRKDGSMRAVISVEKPETLEWLKRDAQHLERALQEAGVKTDSGSLNFALREQRQDGSGGFSRSGSRRGSGFEGAETSEGRMAEARVADAAARRIARGGVDVRI